MKGIQLKQFNNFNNKMINKNPFKTKKVSERITEKVVENISVKDKLKYESKLQYNDKENCHGKYL